jgi:hypothetical protein
MEDANTKAAVKGPFTKPRGVQPDRGRIDFSATLGKPPRPVSNMIPAFFFALQGLQLMS